MERPVLILGRRATTTELKAEPTKLLVQMAIWVMRKGVRYTAHVPHVTILVEEPEVVLVLR